MRLRFHGFWPVPESERMGGMTKVPLRMQVAEAIDNLGYCLLRVDADKHPRLFSASGVPLTTWLRHPGWAWASYRRHLPWRAED